jgi:hypothetical protein
MFIEYHSDRVIEEIIIYIIEYRSELLKAGFRMDGDYKLFHGNLGCV